MSECVPMAMRNDASDTVNSVEAGVKKLAISTLGSNVPPVLRGITGEVKWFSPFVGYGFITREDNEKDIFVHSSAVVRSGKFYHALVEGDKVEFDVVQGLKGPEAWSVTAPGGVVIQGLRIYRSPFRRRMGTTRGPRKTDNYDKTKSEENNNREVEKVEKIKSMDSNASKGEGHRRNSFKSGKKYYKKQRKNSTSETAPSTVEQPDVTSSA